MQKDTWIARSQPGSFLRAKVNMMHGANLAGSSNCYIQQGITESSGSAALELGCEELFPRNGGCINNAAKVQCENEGEGGILLQHL